MQLFSVGTVMLNLDGSVKLDAGGKPIPTYDEDTVKGFAKALSGWTFAGQDQTKSWRWLYPDHLGRRSRHSHAEELRGVGRADGAVARELSLRRRYAQRSPAPPTTPARKQLLVLCRRAVQRIAGRVRHAQVDLDNVIDNVFNHPNLGPFLSKQLIQRLVTSNPESGIRRARSDGVQQQRQWRSRRPAGRRAGDPARRSRRADLAVAALPHVRQADRAGGAVRTTASRVQCPSRRRILRSLGFRRPYRAQPESAARAVRVQFLIIRTSRRRVRWRSRSHRARIRDHQRVVGGRLRRLQQVGDHRWLRSRQQRSRQPDAAGLLVLPRPDQFADCNCSTSSTSCCAAPE